MPQCGNMGLDHPRGLERNPVRTKLRSCASGGRFLFPVIWSFFEGLK